MSRRISGYEQEVGTSKLSCCRRVYALITDSNPKFSLLQQTNRFSFIRISRQAPLHRLQYDQQPLVRTSDSGSPRTTELMHVPYIYMHGQRSITSSQDTFKPLHMPVDCYFELKHSRPNTSLAIGLFIRLTRIRLRTCDCFASSFAKSTCLWVLMRLLV